MTFWRWLFFLIKVGVVAVLAVWVAARPGHVSFTWLGYRLDTSIGARPVDALDQAGAQSVIQPVERRVVEGDHCHRVVQLIVSADDSCSFDPCYYAQLPISRV